MDQHSGRLSPDERNSLDSLYRRERKKRKATWGDLFEALFEMAAPLFGLLVLLAIAAGFFLFF